MKREIGIGLLGFGVVGSQVARVLVDKAKTLAGQVGCPLVLRKIKTKRADIARPKARGIPAQLFTTDTEEFFNTPGIDIIIEVIGGETPAHDYMTRALTAGKHVVTANKEVIAKHGVELHALARQQNVGLRYEGSVGGGIPLIAPFKYDLVANELKGIYAIINGTTNYILTRMDKEGLDFAVALKSAQELGYAEANPANDIEGIDAKYKLAILASLGFQTQVRPDDIHTEGISRIGSRDFRYAHELGFTIKLLAIAKQSNNSVEARVHPVLVPLDSFLAKVDGVYNAILVEGDLVGKVLFFGEGAGALPTSSAVIADVVSTAQDILLGISDKAKPKFDSGKKLKPMADLETRFYLRINVTDRPGVLAQISRVFGDNGISIASVIQKETDIVAQVAEVVITTHKVKEKAMQQALADLAKLPVVKEVNNFIRVEDI